MANPWPNPGVGQTLDNYGIWTDSGLILDLMVYILIFHFLLKDLGQQLDINWTSKWEMVGQQKGHEVVKPDYCNPCK